MRSSPVGSLALRRSGDNILIINSLSTSKILAAPFLVPTAVILLLSCGGPSEPRHFSALIDTSGTIPKEVTEKIKASVTESVAKFAANAKQGDTYTLWWLSPDDGSPYPAQHKTFVMGALKPPAYRSRVIATKNLQKQVEEALEELPEGVNQTPLLESICLLASTVATDSVYSLSVWSDLHQESSKWQRVKSKEPETPKETASRMLALCGPVATPPQSVTLNVWPGRTGGRDHSLEIFSRDRNAWVEYIDQWAPGTSVEVVHLQ